MRRTVFAAMLCICVLAPVGPPARGAEESAPEEWIFSVILPPRWNIADAVFAYQYKGNYYLPLVQLAEGFEFFVEAEVDRVFAKGFAGREENSFTFDGERGEVIVKGQASPLPPDALLPVNESPGDDIYVQLEVLNALWPVNMRIDLASLTVFVETQEELSFIRRKEREERKSVFSARQAQQEAEEPKNLPFHDNPYQWFGRPVLDIQSAYTYDNGKKKGSGSTNISGTQQLGKFTADYAAAYSLQNGRIVKPSTIRTKFTRQAIGAENLLVPGLKRIEFGDVSATQKDLIGKSASGRGIILSNTPSTRTREFDRITVEGRAPPGWETELYNNNELLEFGTVGDDGEYRFEDVVLNFGNNRIRVILYGPQGQVREDVQEYDIGGNILSPGEFQYRAGLVDTGRSFIQLEEPANPEKTEATRNAEFSYGLNDWLTLSGSYTKTPLNKKDLQAYYTAGLAFNSPVGLGEIEGYRQVNGGSAVDLRFITKILGLRLNTRGAVFNHFESAEAGSKRYEVETQANTTADLPLLPPIALRLSGAHREFEGGTNSSDFETAQSFTGAGLRFGHSTTSHFEGGTHTQSSGSMSVTWNRSVWGIRGGATYSLYPILEMGTGNAEIRYKTPKDFQAAVNMQHDFVRRKSTAGTQIGYDFGDILTTADAQYRQGQGWLFALRATTALSPYGPGRLYRLSSDTQRTKTPVLGHVFLDRDGDGVFGEGDEAIPGARLKVGRAHTRMETDENGYVVAPLHAHTVEAVTLDEGSLEDPYYRAAVRGYSTIGRSGSMPGFEFPVVETGAIDGTVAREPAGTPVQGMTLHLVDAGGTVVMTAETAYDGYYSFEFVLPGTYTVRADPSYQVNVPTETVTVSSEELFAFGVDLTLLEPAVEESAADNQDGESGRIAQTNHAPAVHGTEQPAPASLPDEGRSLAGEEDPSDGGRSATVKGVRVGEHPDRVRLVLDLSGPIDFSLDDGGTGLVVLLDLPGSDWQAKAEDTFARNPVLKAYATEPLPDGGTRVVLKAREAMRVKDSVLLPAGSGHGDRLYLDLENGY